MREKTGDRTGEKRQRRLERGKKKKEESGVKLSGADAPVCSHS